MTGNKHEAKHLLKDHLYRAFRFLRVTISAGGPACRCYMDCAKDGLVVGQNVWQLVMPDNAAADAAKLAVQQPVMQHNQQGNK